MRLYEFKVVALRTGAFPLDMLRYDSCWPASQASVEALRQGGKDTIVVLRSIKRPTPDRWASFGWKVHDTVVVKL